MTAISIKKLVFTVPNRSVPILNHIDLSIESGEFVILLGSNGSGKSSLLKLIDGVDQPTRGDIQFDEMARSQYGRQFKQQPIVRLTQDYQQSLFCSLTVLENCLIADGKNRQKRHGSTRNFFKTYLAKFNRHLPMKLDMAADLLSGGEKQALVLALKILHPPKILLLDEHTSALDPQSAERLMMLTQAAIETHQLTCVLTTHNLELALQYGSRIVVLSQGSIVRTYDQAAKEKLTRHELEEIYA